MNVLEVLTLDLVEHDGRRPGMGAPVVNTGVTPTDSLDLLHRVVEVAPPLRLVGYTRPYESSAALGIGESSVLVIKGFHHLRLCKSTPSLIGKSTLRSHSSANHLL